jgi:hypothetical protein
MVKRVSSYGASKGQLRITALFSNSTTKHVDWVWSSTNLLFTFLTIHPPTYVCNGTGCGFVRYKEHTSCDLAIAALHENIPAGVSPLPDCAAKSAFRFLYFFARDNLLWVFHARTHARTLGFTLSAAKKTPVAICLAIEFTCLIARRSLALCFSQTWGRLNKRLL